VKTVQIFSLSRIGRSFLLDNFFVCSERFRCTAFSFADLSLNKENLSQNIYTGHSSNILLSFHSASLCNVLV